MTSLRKQPAPKRIFAGFVGLTLATSLAGCSTDGDNDDALEVTTDASVEGTTEYLPASEDGPAQNVPEPRLPAVATENSDEGAEATLQYFWEAVDYARLSGDTSPLSLVSDASCEFCDEYIDGWKKRYDDGNWAVIHGEVEVEIVESNTYFDEQQQDEWTEISYELTEPAADLYVDGQQDSEESFEKGSTVRWTADLIYDATAQRWHLEWAGRDQVETENTQ